MCASAVSEFDTAFSASRNLPVFEERLHLRPHLPVAGADAQDEPESLEGDHESDDPHEGERVQEYSALAEEVQNDVQGVHGLLQVGSLRGLGCRLARYENRDYVSGLASRASK